MAHRTSFALRALDIVRLLGFSLFTQFLHISVADGYAIEQFPKAGDWVPISREVIYNRYRNNIEHNQGFDSGFQRPSWEPSQDLTTNIHEATENVIRIVSPNVPATKAYVVDNFETPDIKNEGTSINAKQKQKFNKTCSEGATNCIPIQIQKEVANKSSTRLRSQLRSLKLEDIQTLNTIAHKKGKLNHVQIKPVTSKDDESLYKDSVRKTYEVSEHLIDQSTEETIHKEDNGYIYDVPNVMFTDTIQNNSITSDFLAILAKYNISKDDHLKNYELSRLETSSNNVLNHKPIGIILQPWGDHQKYNSQNHLPLNPLLAVYLSNYGFYLPGYYKMNGGYKNLYGYLASNNIHNNKPFGPYKVFSDTDALN